MLRLKTHYLLIFLGFLAACSLPNQKHEKSAIQLPKGFLSTTNDSGRVALPSWKSVYFDTSLNQLIDEAIVKNFELRSAMQRVESFRSQVVLNKGIRLPDLNANISMGARKFGEYTMDGVGNYDTRFSPNLNSKQQLPQVIPDYIIGLQSNWEIDLWGKLKNRKKAALNRFLAGEMGRNLVLTSTVAEVASAYYSLLALDSEQLIYMENIALQQSALDVVRILKETGQSNQLGVEIIEAQLLSSQEKEVEVEQRIIEAENTLNFLLGRFPQPIIRSNDLLNKSLPTLVKSGIPSDMLQNRPDIVQAELELAASHADVVSAKVAFYPSLNINAGFGFQALNAALLLEAPASIAYSGLGGLAAPLLNRRVLKSQLLSAEVEKKQAYIQYEKVVTRSFTEVYTSLTQLNNVERMLTIKNQEVQILRNSINTSNELFRTGRATYLEVNTVQKNALQSQLESINLKKMQFQALVELYRSLGGGWK